MENNERQIFEAILCALVAQAGGTVRLSVPAVVACGSAYRLRPLTDWDGQTLVLTLDAADSDADDGLHPRRHQADGSPV